MQCAKNLYRAGIKEVYFIDLHKVDSLVFLIAGGVQVFEIDEEGNILRNLNEIEEYRQHVKYFWKHYRSYLSQN